MKVSSVDKEGIEVWKHRWKADNVLRNGGEYYTPRPLIKSIIKVVNPVVGETVYDGAVGSAGFLVEAFDYMKKSKSLTANQFQKLQIETFYGKEKISLAKDAIARKWNAAKQWYFSWLYK